jgi:hypothetical protein
MKIFIELINQNNLMSKRIVRQKKKINKNKNIDPNGMMNLFYFSGNDN